MEKSIEITKNERVFFCSAHLMSELLGRIHIFSFRASHIMPGRISLFYAAQFLRLCFEVFGLSSPPSNRAEHLLIHRIQSHTNPKRRKGFLKQAGQKSVKEEVAEQRKRPKRAEKWRLKVQTHIWDCIPRHSNPTRRTKHCQTERKSIKHQQKAADYLYPFSPFLAIPNAETSRRRPLHRNIFHDKLLAFCMTGK